MRVSATEVLFWLKRRAENIAVLLLAIVFVSFLLQITFRYVLGWPVGWTLEVSTLAWMWLVLWGAAFVVPEKQEIRFDILYGAVSGRTKRVFTFVTAVILIGFLLVSLPATVDYVTFMKVEKASYIHVGLDYLFSVYIVFAVAAIARYGWLLLRAVKGDPHDETDPSLLRDE